MKQVYGVQKWTHIGDEDRINTYEIMEEADWFDRQSEALDAAEAILSARPEGVTRVTVGRFYDSGEYRGEMVDDRYIFDKDVA